MGRKTRLTPEIQAQIVTALSSGNWQEVACEYAGIHVATYYRWLERGQEEIARLDSIDDTEPLEEETPYREFCEAVRKAQAVAEVQAVGLIRKAAVEGSWQAAGWYLERSHAKRWSKVDKLEHTGKEGTPIQLSVSVADLEKEIESLLEGSRGTTRDDTDSNA